MDKPNSTADLKEITKPLNILKTIGSSLPGTASLVEAKNQIESGILKDKMASAELKLLELESRASENKLTSLDWVKAVGEYSLRTVSISIHYDGKWECDSEAGKEKFLCFGTGCIIDEHEMITADETIKIAEVLIEQRGGQIMITNGISTFKCFFDQSSSAQGITSTKIERDIEREMEIKDLMKDLNLNLPSDEIIKSKVKYSLIPYLGSNVGFLHIGQAQNAYTMYFNSSHLQFESSVISYFQEPTNNVLKSFATLPISSRILSVGSPLFDKNGYLLGIITKTERLEDDHNFRVIASGLIAHPSFAIDNM